MPNFTEEFAAGMFTNSNHAAPPTASPAPAAPPQASPTPEVDAEEHARQFYANTDWTKPADKPAASPTENDKTAAVLYAEKPPPARLAEKAIPEAIKALRTADEARNFYSNTTQSEYAHAITAEHLITEGLPETVTAEVREGIAHELREMAVDCSLSVQEVSSLVAEAKRIYNEGPPDEATEQTWRTAACKRLVELADNDPVKAQADLDLARKLVARDPRLGRLLETTRLGDSPAVVELFFNKARAERARGRL